MNEMIRKTVLEYLALRSTGAYEVQQITRMINMRGMLDEKLEESQVEAALVFLKDLEYVKNVRGGLGKSVAWCISAKGTLYFERGE